MVVNKSDIGLLVERWVISRFSTNFRFRDFQKEVIVDVIYSFLSDDVNYIMQAPTGSGKSIIAIVIAGVLSEYYNKSGYILISDLSLVNQYERDINMRIPDWGIIRGQHYYNCLENGMPYPMGECKLKVNGNNFNTSECSEYCPYLIAKRKSLNSRVTVCTYQYWLTHVNDMVDTDEDNNMRRDFVICDEAHKLSDIIQTKYSLTIGEHELNAVELLCEEFTSSLNEKARHADIEFKNAYEALRECDTNYLQRILEIIKQINHNAIGPLFSCLCSTKVDQANYIGNTNRMRSVMNALIWLKEFNTQSVIYMNTSISNMDNIVLSINPKSVVLNSIDEGNLMDKYFHSNFNHCLYMSATIGNPYEFAKNCNFIKFKYANIPSQFDFSKSPIYYVPGYKMSYTEKTTSLPKICEMVDDIMNIYKDFRGVILVSSYDMSLQIKDALSQTNKDRIITYSNAKEKEIALSDYTYSKNKVLIGPSLFDGISLDDDKCRFIIIGKVPYPDLKNNFISRKKDISNIWYNNQAIMSLVQGIGRGVRSKTDWCVSFILDGSFVPLAQRYATYFDDTFTMNNRVIQITPEQLKI